MVYRSASRAKSCSRCRPLGKHFRSPTPMSETPTSIALTPWLARSSVGPRKLHQPGPDEHERSLLFAAAANVFDNGRLRPCRFVAASAASAAKRELLAEAFVRYATESRGLASSDDLDPSIHAAERAKAFNAPCLLLMLARVREDLTEIPAHEQWISVGASLGNLMAASTALGYAGKIVSGPRVRHHAVQAVVCEAEEPLVGFIYLGTRELGDSARGTAPSASLKKMPSRHPSMAEVQ